MNHWARNTLSVLFSGIFGVLLALPGSTLHAAVLSSCPASIDGNDCVANDLQPTGAEVVNGPTACTEGELFSATVRIHFADGGGANTRFNVGFYVGNAGESAIGGASCTFDSLQPIGFPLSPGADLTRN